MADELAAWLEGAAGGRPAIAGIRGHWSHGELRDEALRIAAGLPQAARIVIASRPDPASLLTTLAVWATGAMAIPIDAREPAAIAAVGRFADAPTVGSAALAAAGGLPPRPRPDGARIALRTSGSSGLPKLAVHAWSSLAANAVAARRRVPFGPDHRWLLSLAPHHIGGLAVLVRAVVGGGSIAIGRGPSGVAEDLRDDPAVTHTSLVATQLRDLLDRAAQEPVLDRRLRSLTAILVGGGPTPAPWRNAALERGWPIMATYGSTECASQISTGRPSLAEPPSFAGAPLDGISVEASAEGELLVAGPTLFAGYLGPGGGVERRCDSFGRYATGDLGFVDAVGAVHVLGRKDAMFISGGENIRPEEIEAVLAELPGVRSVCVVGAPHPRWVTRPIAFVSGPLDAASAAAALAARLPRFRWPDAILAMPEAEASRAKPRRRALLAALDAPVVWRAEPL